jgi:tight adherence protein B
MDYDKYTFSMREYMVMVGQFVLLAAIAGKLFYGNILFGLLMIPFVVMFIKWKRKLKTDRRKRELRFQFRDALNSISDLLSVGYSVENSIRECYKEMAILHGRESVICKELSLIVKKTELNIPIENTFVDLGRRSGIDDLNMFGQIFINAKRTGENLVAVISMVSGTISQSFEVEEEISHIIGEKKLEAYIMDIAPLAVLAYVGLTGGGMMDVMYETFIGRIVMTVCLAVYLVTVFISLKLTKVKI